MPFCRISIYETHNKRSVEKPEGFLVGHVHIKDIKEWEASI